MDLYADRPWALSPAMASMNHLALTEKPQEGPVVKEDSVERIKHQCEGEYDASGASCWVLPWWRSLDRADVADNYPPEGGDEKAQAAARKRWMAEKANREKISLNHDTHVSMEFCNGYLGEYMSRNSLHTQLHSCSTAIFNITPSNPSPPTTLKRPFGPFLVPPLATHLYPLRKPARVLQTVSIEL